MPSLACMRQRFHDLKIVVAKAAAKTTSATKRVVLGDAERISMNVQIVHHRRSIDIHLRFIQVR